MKIYVVGVCAINCTALHVHNAPRGVARTHIDHHCMQTIIAVVYKTLKFRKLKETAVVGSPWQIFFFFFFLSRFYFLAPFLLNKHSLGLKQSAASSGDRFRKCCQPNFSRIEVVWNLNNAREYLSHFFLVIIYI